MQRLSFLLYLSSSFPSLRTLCLFALEWRLISKWRKTGVTSFACTKKLQRTVSSFSFSVSWIDK
uniref:Secreted protein n=1 Tax=Brassica oleracea TaxID=3712 RepID=A0A3P6ETK7_BRAOL|nr:unnamed protein product [Brassica oleracea]